MLQLPTLPTLLQAAASSSADAAVAADDDSSNTWLPDIHSGEQFFFFYIQYFSIFIPRHGALLLLFLIQWSGVSGVFIITHTLASIEVLWETVERA